MQAILSSWRADAEGFSVATIGWMMTGYPVGTLIGSLFSPYLVRLSGHVRAYAFFATLSSTAILIQSVFIDPSVWFFMRLLSGFCLAGIFVIVESWLNSKSNNDNRGNIFSIYMLVIWVGAALGQSLLTLDDPRGFNLFVLTSVLLSVSLIPVLITKIEAPRIEQHKPLGIVKLCQMSPTSAATIVLSALVTSAFFGMGAVFAIKAGLSVTKTAMFMTLFVASGAISQWPLGRLSDKIDRRLVILFCACCVVSVSVMMFFAEPNENLYLLMSILMGGSILPLYSLAVAHTNDRLKPEHMMGASSAIIMLWGCFAMIAPFAVGNILEIFSLRGFYVYTGVSQGLLALVVLFMLFKTKAVEDESQAQFKAMSHHPSLVALEVVAEEAIESTEAEDTGV